MNTRLFATRVACHSQQTLNLAYLFDLNASPQDDSVGEALYVAEKKIPCINNTCSATGLK